MSFQADAGFMSQVAALLQLWANPERSSQERARSGQEQLQQHPLFMAHLCSFLLASSCDRYLRQLAGILLKNFVRRHYGATPESARAQLRPLLLPALADPLPPVRRAAAAVVLAIAQKEEGFARWPGLLEGLVEALSSSSPALQDGALYTIELLCEDMTRELEDSPKRPLNAIVPVLIRLMGVPSAQLRALKALNNFVVDWPNAMKVNSEAFLNGVFACANSKDVEVCRHVCRTFNTLCDVKPDLIGPFINSVSLFCLAQTSSKDSDLKCEACEFWQVVAEQVLWHDTLRARVPALLPLLLQAIVYELEDVEALLELDDATVPLAEKHIAPWFAKGKGKRGKSGDDDGEDKGDVDPSMAWSLRKSAAAALDAVCGAFGDEILTVLMPLLRERLQSPKWEVRESAILALGAAADGTINGLVPMLPGLLSSLVQLVETAGQQPPLLAASACWTTGRLSSWTVRQPRDDMLARQVRALAALLPSPSRRVQEASCSALLVVVQETWALCRRVSEHNTIFAPFLMPCVSALVAALPRYQAKNLLIAYDLLAALLRGASPENVTQAAGLVWPTLLRALSGTPPDRRLVALLDCTASCVLLLGPTVGPHAVSLLRPSFSIGMHHLRAASERSRLEQSLLAELRASRPESTSSEASDVVLSRLGQPSFDLDFAIVALDLAGSVAEALGSQSKGALSQVGLGELVLEAVACSNAAVRQAAFGLVGDLARHCCELLPGPRLLQPIVDALYGSNVNLCMNASWALGELAARVSVPKEVAEEAFTRLRRVLCRDHDSGLLRNVAITICRLAPVCAPLIASQLHEIGPYFIAPLLSVKAALQQLPRIAALLHSWTGLKSDLPPAVRQGAKEVLGALMGNAEWNRRWTAIPPEQQQFIEQQLK